MAGLLYSNPRLLLLLLGIIGVAGFSSYTTLPRIEDPVLVQRFGFVRTIFPGADAKRVETLISRPLEEDISTINGIKKITSESMAGISSIAIELKEEITDVETVWSKVRDEVSESAKTLPKGAFTPDFNQPKLSAYSTIIALKWAGTGETNFAILGRLAEDLKGKIRSITGTESVKLYGKQDEEVLVEVPDGVLQRTGLTIGDISRQIEKSESKGSAGMFRSTNTEMVVEVDQDFKTLKRIGETPISHGARGNFSNLSEISKISKTVKRPAASEAVVDGLDSVVIAAYVRDESRIDLWTEKLEEELKSFRDTLPPKVELDVLFTQNKYVTDRLFQLVKNMLVGTLAVVIVVFLLMGWRSMLVVGAALPLSALMVITGMRFLGIPIQQMSVTGLIIALGLLIDNAIVMVDEVSTELREGKSAKEAIGKTIRHLGLPLFGSTVTTTLAFAPIALLPGSSGEFVGSIAISVILAINASFILAMTVVPALTALMRPNRVKSGTQGGQVGKNFLRDGLSSGRLTRLYKKGLVNLFQFPVIGVLLGVSLPLFGLYQAKQLPEQFFPPADREQIQIELELSAASSIEKTCDAAMEIRDSLLSVEGIKRVHWFLGESAPSFFYNMISRRKNAPFYAQAMVEFDHGVESLPMIRGLQDKLDEEFPGVRILVRQLEQGPPFDAPVEVKLFGPDLAELQRLGDEIRLIMSETHEVVHTRSDLSELVPKLSLKLDEYEARLSGLTHLEIEQQLYSSFEGLESGSLVDETEDIPIRVRLDGDIESFEFRALTPRGRAPVGTPLSALGELSLGSEVASIPRIDGRRVNQVKAYITAGTLPHAVVTEFKEKLADSKFKLPSGYSLEYGGEAEKRDEAVGNLMADIPLLIALMIATLVASFRSFRVAFIIALVGGLSIGLGLGALWMFWFPFGFMGVVGTMGLVGVAVNDAIVVMAGIRDNPAARAGNRIAVADVVIRRTRHIIATTLTTIAGFIPLILGGGKFWPPVAITIAGGVGGATILALFFVPSIYLVFIGRSGPEGLMPDSDALENDPPKGDPPSQIMGAPVPLSSPRKPSPKNRKRRKIRPFRRLKGGDDSGD